MKNGVLDNVLHTPYYVINYRLRSPHSRAGRDCTTKERLLKPGQDPVLLEIP